MKKSILSATLTVLVISICGCDNSPHQPDIVETAMTHKTKAVVDQNGTITVGHRSYLPINRSGEPANMTEQILQVLASFETRNPDLVIDSWSIEKRQKAKGTTAWVHGLWVNHHPRDGYLPK